MILCLLIYSMLAIADSWLPAKVIAKISESGNYVVKVIPGESLGEVSGYAGEKTGKHAKTEYYRYRNDAYEKYSEFNLLNPISPVVVDVANNGNLITLDNWHNIGIGYVITIYSAKGKIIKKYKLNDLYEKTKLNTIKMSTSSIWWRCERFPPHMNPNNRSYIIYDFTGNMIEVDIKSGDIKTIIGAVRCSK